MIIESIIGIAVIGAAGYLFWRSSRDAASVIDLNHDGKTDVKDAAVALEKAVEKLVSTVDVNKDGKISFSDAKVVVENVKSKFNEKPAEPVKTDVAASAPKRARNKGKLVADNPATPGVNEAWEGGKAPEKKPKAKKPTKPKMTIAKK